MSDMQTGARAPDSADSAARQADSADSAARQAAGAASQAASDVTETAKDQARRVTSEAGAQARNVAVEVRNRVGEQSRAQTDKLVQSIRRMADELDQMRTDQQDSPATMVVSRVAESGRQLAGYLQQHGPDGVLREVQDFARRRPGAFLATALAAGFVVGRLGKGVMKAGESGSGKPRNDMYRPADTSDATGHPAAAPYGTESAYQAETAYTTGATDTAYATGAGAGYGPGGTSGSTAYAATGTGSPVPLEEPYPGEPPRTVDPNYESRRRR